MIVVHWYSADPHFGDAGIRAFFDRPFATVVAMDAAMLARLTERVGPEDDLWIIGDFAMPELAERIFRAVPGRKHLVRGNHDPDELLALDWTSIHDLVEVQDGELRFVLCHYPLMTWNGVRDGAINLFGHVHTNWQGADNQVNVGVDCWDFAPVTRGDALRRAVGLPENQVWRGVEQQLD